MSSPINNPAYSALLMYNDLASANLFFSLLSLAWRGISSRVEQNWIWILAFKKFQSYFCKRMLQYLEKKKFFAPENMKKKRSQKLFIIGHSFCSVLPTGPRPTQILDIFNRNLPARDLSIMTLFSVVLWVLSELGFIANFKRMWISILYCMSLLESVS